MSRSSLAILALAAFVSCTGRPPPAIVIGRATPPPTVAPQAEVTAAPPGEVRPAPAAPSARRRSADGSGPPAALDFRGAVNVPEHLLFFLVIGSDARPGEDITRTRADSIHIAAVNPTTRRGTVVGLPRDSYVVVPGHGRRKINSALALGGPELLVRTVRELTGLPVSYYALTGFEGLQRMVDELGGLDVFVRQRMDDSSSGARFEPGWHHMNGREVLAYSRNRHLQGGDFTRSENQGGVILNALEKLRAETEDSDGIRRWLGILFRLARLDMSMDDAVRLGSLARSLVPADLVNVVASGSSRNVNGQSVVVLDERAFFLFRDVGADGVADGRAEPPAPTAPPPASPPTTPPPSSEPTPSPSPTPRPSAPPTPSPSPTPLIRLP